MGLLTPGAMKYMTRAATNIETRYRYNASVTGQFPVLPFLCFFFSFLLGVPKSGKSKWGLSKWGLKVLVHDCPRLPTIVVILRRKFPLERRPKRPQKCTIVDDCAQIAESGLKPPFESPHLDFPDKKLQSQKIAKCRIASFTGPGD